MRKKTLPRKSEDSYFLLDNYAEFHNNGFCDEKSNDTKGSYECLGVLIRLRFTPANRSLRSNKVEIIQAVHPEFARPVSPKISI